MLPKENFMHAKTEIANQKKAKRNAKQIIST